jgi:pyridoxine 5-phosphate synthase
MAKLGVNIDHVATVRQARYRGVHDGMRPEPDIVAAALACQRAGASGITVHLREDRRHIQEPDVWAVQKAARLPLNLEMAVTPAMVRFALRLKPDEVCLVPENRQEVTTEGGLNVARELKKIRAAVRQLSKKKILVSAFIDPDIRQVVAAFAAGCPCVELHTGAYANATTKAGKARELRRQRDAALVARALGMRVNAGHGLHYNNLAAYLRAVPFVHTLNIGHAIVSQAIFTGLQQAVRQMLTVIRKAK